MKDEFAVFLRLGAVLSILLVGATGPTRLAAAAAPLPITVYCEVDAFVDSLRERIPRGTPRSDVEKFLVEENGASVQLDDAPQRKPNVVHYSKRIHCPPIGDRDQWTVNVTYDRSDKVWHLSTTSAPDLFPHAIPDDRSDAGIFNFDDYSTPEELARTFEVLFPLGTPRSEVEKVLVQWNRAYAWTNPNEPMTVIYTHEARRLVPKGKSRAFEYQTWTIKVRYLQKFDEVNQIMVSGSISSTAFKHDRNYFLNLNKRNKETK